jgi:hypothetical protein
MMGAERRCTPGRFRRPSEDRLQVAGRLGMVCKASRILACGRERSENPFVQLESAVRRQRLLDRAARQLVPEPDPALGNEHAGRETLLQRVDATFGKSVEEPEVRGCRYDGNRLEKRAGSSAQLGRACEDRVANGVRDLPVSGCECLGDEERVAGGQAVELHVVDARRLGELRDGARRQPFDLQPAHARLVASSPNTTRSGWAR